MLQLAENCDHHFGKRLYGVMSGHATLKVAPLSGETTRMHSLPLLTDSAFQRRHP